MLRLLVMSQIVCRKSALRVAVLLTLQRVSFGTTFPEANFVSDTTSGQWHHFRRLSIQFTCEKNIFVLKTNHSRVCSSNSSSIHHSFVYFLPQGANLLTHNKNQSFCRNRWRGSNYTTTSNKPLLTGGKRRANRNNANWRRSAASDRAVTDS